MVAYSFKAQFADPIFSGRKRQTIRGQRRRHARPGEELQLYTGMRTRQCRLIGRATCTGVTCIAIVLTGSPEVLIPNRTVPDLDGFARADGFTCWQDLHDFWQREHGPTEHFSGVLIEWTPAWPTDAVPA